MENLDLNEIAGLKINTEIVSAELLSVIKRYRKDSISDIKNDIINNELVLSCNYIEDENGINKLIKCYDELVKLNYNVEVFFAGEKEDIQILRNWLQTSNEISEEGWDDFIEDDE